MTRTTHNLLAAMIAVGSLCLLPIVACCGTVLEITDSSATVKVQAIIAPGNVEGVRITSNTVDLSANGVLTAQIVQSAANGAQLLLKNQAISETPNIGSMANPLTGFGISNGITSYIYNRVAQWSWGRMGNGYGEFVGNNITMKDADDTLRPNIHNELNHDGMSWIDNRMPDGVLGHDVAGRFLRFKIGGATGKNMLSVGYYGVQIGTHTISQSVASSTLTVAGTIESKVGGFKFPDGTIQTSAAQAQSPTPVFDYIVLTPRLTPPATPVVGTIYIDSTTAQGRWWNGTQWLVAW